MDLFRQYGFKTITMDDIARAAGISKKTLYQHFDSKNEVVKAVLIWYKSQMTDTCTGLMSHTENALEAMVKVMAFVDETNKQINPIALNELHRFFPDAYEQFRALLVEKDVAMIRENLITGMKEGVYRQNLNADLLARYRLETSLLILQPNLMVNERNSLLKVHQEIAEHFLFGIMSQRGIELYQQYKEKYSS